MWESVTHRVKNIKQPYGGYLPRKMFTHIQLEDDTVLNQNENIVGATIGMVVDYLTRLMLGARPEEAFDISLSGAEVLDKATDSKQASEYAQELLKKVKGLDDQSIINACKLTSYDVCLRAGIEFFNSEALQVQPDKATSENIVTMVNRTLHFLKEHGPIVKDGFTFEGGGYTPTISFGDGDYLTKDTLWDLKVTKKTFDKNYSLQILVYYLMGKHSSQSIYEGIEKIGLFNPRLNEYYILNTSDIPEDIVEEVETEVIGYPDIDEIIENADLINNKNNIFYIENNLLQLNDELTTYRVIDDNVAKSLLKHQKHEYWHKFGIQNKDLEFLKGLNYLYQKNKIIREFKENNAETIYSEISDKDYEVAEDKGQYHLMVNTSALKKAIKEYADIDDPNVQSFLEFLKNYPHPWYLLQD